MVNKIYEENGEFVKGVFLGVMTDLSFTVAVGVLVGFLFGISYSLHNGSMDLIEAGMVNALLESPFFVTLLYTLSTLATFAGGFVSAVYAKKHIYWSAVLVALIVLVFGVLVSLNMSQDAMQISPSVNDTNDALAFFLIIPIALFGAYAYSKSRGSKAVTYMSNLSLHLSVFFNLNNNLNYRQAFLFYIGHLIFYTFLFVLIQPIIYGVFEELVFQTPILTILGFVYVELLLINILNHRNLFKNHKALVLTLGAGLVTIIGGPIFGLLIPAYLLIGRIK